MASSTLERALQKLRAATVAQGALPIEPNRKDESQAGVIDEDAHDQDDMVERACRIAFKERFAKAGQRIIIVAGLPLGTPGATNFMRIAYVGEDKTAE